MRALRAVRIKNWRLKYVLSGLAGILLATVGWKLHLLSHRQTLPFKTVATNSTVGVITNDVSREIHAAMDFVQQFLQGYRTALRERVPVASQKQFFLSGTTNIGGRLLLSRVSECFLYLFPGSENQLVVDGSRFPAQVPVFLNLSIFGNNANLIGSYQSFIDEYRRDPGVVRLDRSSVSFIDASFEVPELKLFWLTEDSIILLINFTSRVWSEHGEANQKCDHLAFLTGARSFGPFVMQAAALGTNAAISDFMRTWIKSYFFSSALANDLLNPFA